MIFSWEWIKTFFGKDLPSFEEVVELIDKRAFGVEEIKQREGRKILDLEIRSNRPDCLSHRGIAKEIEVLTGAPLVKDPYSLSSDLFQVSDLEIEIESPRDCPVYLGLIVEGVKVTETDPVIKDLLADCNVGSINNIVDLTNFVMLETGQPLHVFDLDKISKKIVVRRAREGEKIKALDGNEYFLSPFNLVIADTEKILAIAGVKGGVDSSVSEKTSRILVESALFDRVVVRRSSRTLGLSSDASFRFEHGLFEGLPLIGILRFAQLLEEKGWGKVVGIVGVLPETPLSKKITFRPQRVKEVLGFDVERGEQEEILQRLGCTVKKNNDVWEVEPPLWRRDLSIAEDLVEEIGRIKGYHNIPTLYAREPLVIPQHNLFLFWEEKVRYILASFGLDELYSYAFVPKDALEIMGIDEGKAVKIENPVSDRYVYLAPTLIFNVLQAIKENSKRFSEIRVFEIGKVFAKKGKDSFEERKSLVIALASSFKKDEEMFFELKGIVSDLFEGLGITDLYFDKAQPLPLLESLLVWHLGKTAELRVGEKKIGFLGEISSYTLAELSLPAQVVVAEIDLEALVNMACEQREYKPISPYPSSIKDISVLVPRTTLVDEVLQVLQEALGETLVDVELFDYYEGENIPEGKKSLAFRLVFQAPDHTLSPQEIDGLLKTAIRALEDNPEWEVRKEKHDA